MQILDRAKLWKEGMMEQIKREITIMKDLREFPHLTSPCMSLSCVSSLTPCVSPLAPTCEQGSGEAAHGAGPG